MEDFSFNNSFEDRHFEEILKERKRKVSRQQLVFLILFLILLWFIGMYMARRVIYADFDGYMTTDYHNLRAMEDLFVHKTYCNIGDRIEPGDTLLSYVFTSHFMGNENVFSEPDVLSQNRKLRTDYSLAGQDVHVLKVRIGELKRRLEVQDHNIRFGLSSNAHKLELEQALAEAQEELRTLERKLAVLRSAVNETEQLLVHTHDGKRIISYNDMRNTRLMEEMGLMRYSIAATHAVVNKIWIPNSIGVLKGEPLIQTQDLDLKSNNLGITCLVPIRKMSSINYRTQVEVIVNKQVSFHAHVRLIGTRTETIPEHLRNTFERENVAIAADLEIDPGQIIPFWALVKNTPVTVRVRKHLFPGRRDKIRESLYYETTRGTLIDSVFIRPTR